MVKDITALGGSIKKLMRYPRADQPQWSAFNPSIARAESGGFRMLIRSSNYFLDEHNGQTTLLTGHEINSRLWIAKLDENLDIQDHQEVRFDHGTLQVRRGVEDARLFWRDGWMFTAVMLERGHTPRARLAEYRLNEDGTATFIQKLETPTPALPEKNWMAPDMPTEEFDYIYSPSKAYKDGQLHLISGAPKVSVRGSSGLLRQEDGTYLAIVHRVDVNESTVWDPRRFVHEKRSVRNYTHLFARYSDKGCLIGLSDEFVFQGPGVEFASGLTERGSDLVISYGKKDIAANLAIIPKSVVIEITKPMS